MNLLNKIKSNYIENVKSKHPSAYAYFQQIKSENSEFFAKNKLKSLFFLKNLIKADKTKTEYSLVELPKGVTNFQIKENILTKYSTAEDIIKILEKYDVISFDIFDTCIFRKVNTPKDLFKLLEEQNYIEGFASLRVSAESVARNRTKKAFGEININDIYTELIKMCACSLDDIDKELSLEKEVCFANPIMLEVYNHLKSLNKTIIFTSDMYLPIDFMKELLEKNGYTNYEKLWLSNDCLSNKATGKIFTNIKKQYKNQSIIHIGDNYNADVLNAKKTKISAVYYKINVL